MRYKFTLSNVFIVAVGAMLSGLFIVPGLAFEKSGPAVILGFLLSGFLALTGMLSKGELTSAMPKSGVAYFYVTRSFGPAFGTMYGLITWLSLSLKSSVELIAVSIFAHTFIDIDFHIIAISLTILLLLLNLIGIEKVGKIQSIMVFIIVLLLGIFVIKGFSDVDINHFTPFAPNGVKGIFATAGFVFICFGGLLKVASIAEETENPGRNIPWGMIFSFIFIIVLYSIVIFVTIGIVDITKFSGTLTPITDGAKVIMGSKGEILFSIAASLAIISATNAGILAASRYPFALSKDGMLPEIFGKLNRFHTPRLSLIFTAFLIIGFLFVDLKLVIKAASAVLIITYIFACLTLIVMRESGLNNYRPQFKAPFYPWLQILGIIGYVALLYGIGFESLLVMLVLFLVGFVVYWFYGRKKGRIEYALLHIIERIFDKELTDHSLENELKEIVRGRDSLSKDRFDTIVDQSDVIDIENSITVEELFEKISESLSIKTGESKENIYKKLIKREGQTSTAITPFLAIPHLILDGEKKFEMVILRCKKGIKFSDEFPDIHMIFAVAGSEDERNFHLRVLAKIAQMICSDDFQNRWMKAKNCNNIKDLIHLGSRMRYNK